MLLLVGCAVLGVAAAAVSHTITYDNGDVYTVGDNEYVFVSTEPNLYSYHPYSKSVQFKKLWPTEKVDQPIPTPNPNPMGTPQWCADHVPYEFGYSFTDQYWERRCDTNKDREFGCGDELFDPETMLPPGAECPAGF